MRIACWSKKKSAKNNINDLGLGLFPNCEGCDPKVDRDYIFCGSR